MTRQMHREILAQVLGCPINELLAQYKNFTSEIQSDVVMTLSFEKTVEAKKATEVFA